MELKYPALGTQPSARVILLNLKDALLKLKPGCFCSSRESRADRIAGQVAPRIAVRRDFMMSKAAVPNHAQGNDSLSDELTSLSLRFDGLPAEIAISIVEYLFVDDIAVISFGDAFEVNWEEDCEHRKVRKEPGNHASKDVNENSGSDGGQQELCILPTVGSKEVNVASKATSVLAKLAGLPGIFDVSSSYRHIAAKALFDNKSLLSVTKHMHRATLLSLQSTVFLPYVRSLTLSQFSLFDKPSIAKGHCEDLLLITSLPNLHTLRIIISEDSLTLHSNSYGGTTSTDLVHGPSGSKGDYSRIFDHEQLEVIKLIKQCSWNHHRPCQSSGRWQWVHDLRFAFEMEAKKHERQIQVLVVDGKKIKITREMW